MEIHGSLIILAFSIKKGRWKIEYTLGLKNEHPIGYNSILSIPRKFCVGTYDKFFDTSLSCQHKKEAICPSLIQSRLFSYFSGSRIDPKGENYSGRHNGWLLAEFLLERQTSLVAEIACQHKMRGTCWHPFPQCSINRGSAAKPTNHSFQRQTRRWLLCVSLPTVYVLSLKITPKESHFCAELTMWCPPWNSAVSAAKIRPWSWSPSAADS